jgi:pre-mRNA-splicing factor ATP-dependent RNA helicase DHX16
MPSKKAETWCSDTLHSILGCSDSALSLFLTTSATNASSHHAILRILQDANVTPVNAKANNPTDQLRILNQFAQDLFRKCHEGQSKSMTKDERKRMTNADWVENAKSYDLLHDEEQQQKPSSLPIRDDPLKKVTRTSAGAPPSQISVKKKMKESSSDERKKIVLRGVEKRKARRRRADSTSSDDSKDSHSHPQGKHVDIRRRYEAGVEERRNNREHDRAKRRHKASRSNSLNDSDADGNGAKHVSEDESNLTKEQRAELERERDIRERDEFAKRLLERDKKKPTVLTRDGNDDDDDGEGDDHQKLLDMEQRLTRGETVYDDNTGDQITLQSLRKESRRAYLKKRTERELTLLERELEDENEMFDADELTEVEKKRLQLRKEVLKLAKGDKSKDDKNDGFYRLPHEYEELEGDTKAEKDSTLLKARYIEEIREKSEQQLWEEEQAKNASIGYGKKGTRNGKEYGLVFEDQIDFVMTGKKKGYDNRKEKQKRRRRRRDSDNDSDSSRSVSTENKEKEATAVEKSMTKHEKILAGRKKLPVFPYREEFLSAVKENQILILVGETGSGKT